MTQSMSSARRRLLILLVALATMLALFATSNVAANEEEPGEVAFWLSVLHNNDGESDLIGGDFGGIDRFATVVRDLTKEANRMPRTFDEKGRRVHSASIMVSSGDNFLAGPEFNVSLDNGVPFFDAIGMDLIGYDAVAIGNHDFDFGPDVLADFINSYNNPPPYLSANLDFSNEPNLQALVDAGVIGASTVVTKRHQDIGIIGATTPNITFISSPRDVIVMEDIAALVQAEVDALEAEGVNKIVFISHLQDIDGDIELATMLDGVDIMVAGGGDEVLANPGDLLVPGDEVFGPYPMIATDIDGTEIPVVTTAGSYQYVGKLVVGFDAHGNVVEIVDELSRPVRVSAVEPDAARPFRPVRQRVVKPVQAGVDALAANVIGTSEVDLDGLRANVRSVETNEGNLIADSLLWQANLLAADFGVPEADVALQNGGGIRNDSIIPAGDITELDTFDMVPFPNFVSVIPDIPREQFKEILENAVSRNVVGDTPGGTGRFAQIAGFSYVYDSSGTAQVLDPDGNVVTPGTRVQEVVLDDGTPIVSGGAVVPGADLVIATIDFLANGGDQYPYRGAPFTKVGVSYQQAVENYITDALGGLIAAADYPEGGEGRITRIDPNG